MIFLIMENVIFKEKKTGKQSKQETSPNFVVNWVIALTFLVISSFLIFNSIRSFQITNDKLAILEKARTDVTDFRLKNIKLILEKEKIETDDFTETDIRNRLNYSKKNEILFVLSDQAIETALIEVKEIVKEQEKDIVEKSVAMQWIEFFNGGI
jgi:cell division protein FtsB